MPVCVCAGAYMCWFAYESVTSDPWCLEFTKALIAAMSSLCIRKRRAHSRAIRSWLTSACVSSGDAGGQRSHTFTRMQHTNVNVHDSAAGRPRVRVRAALTQNNAAAVADPAS